MLRPLRLLLSASAAALILSAAPGGRFAFVAPGHAQADVVITASIAPPALPAYSQPPIPGPGFVWIPGYWAWDGQEYYWVPGFWEMPPAVGLYWTPPYWAWENGDYAFNAGYWGPTVGFYGGIDYGFGYPGAGYFGGYWRNNGFVYNAAVNNFGNVRIANTYTRTVVKKTYNRVAFNGGPGGITVKPTAAELAAAHERRMGTTAAQMQHQQMAGRNPALRFSANHGNPPIAAAKRANQFSGAHVVAATGGAAATGAGAHAAALYKRPALPHGAQAAPHVGQAAPRAPAGPHVAARAPAFHPQVAARAPAFHPNFAARAPAFHPTFAARAPAMPHFAGGGPHFAAPHFAGGGPHFGGAPHMGGPGPRRP